MEPGFVQKLKTEIELSPSVPDENTKDEKRSIYQNQWDEATLKNFQLNQEARKKYSHRIFGMTLGWLIFVALVVILQGFKVFTLSNTVLVSLLGTTTVNVFGFFVIVTQYLFNKDKST